MRQKVPLWYTAADADTPLHPDIPIKTAIVMPTFSYETQQEFFCLFFSFQHIEVSPPGSRHVMSTQLSPDLSLVVACQSSSINPASDLSLTWLWGVFVSGSQSSSATIAFLRHLSKAAVVACGLTFVKSIIDTVHQPSQRGEKINDVSSCHVP
jgi:hypothetical protein